MAGQVWSTNSLGGFMFSVNLSRKLRTALQPMVRFRQFCDAKEAFGLGIGDTFHWNIYSDVATAGGALVENQLMPETNFTITQASAVITEYGNSVPFTKKLDDLSEQPVTEIIHRVLKNDARKVLDLAAYNQFVQTPIRVTGNGSTTAGGTGITVVTNGTVTATASSFLSSAQVKLIADRMAEDNVPAFDGVNYIAIFRPSAIRGLKNNLEAINQYTPEGWHVIMNGEKGRYEGIRFVEQTNVPVGTNAGGSTLANTDRGFFFGSDTVAEVFAIPEEIRGKIPTDYGRSRGIAWYAELAFGIAHTEVPGARIYCWDSAA